MNILVAPLDWGLGHATRCIPVIDALVARGASVWLGGSGASLQLLRMQYPDLPCLELPAYDVRYSKKKGQLGAIAWQIPRLLKVIQTEHKVLNRAIREKGIELCISDNRYGLWSKQIPTVFICHQLALPLPYPVRGLAAGLNALHYRFISRFDKVWIPDLPGPDNLGGKLSHPVSLPPGSSYIGLLSRFSGLNPARQFQDPRLTSVDMDLLAVLSGPEPQRSLLEEQIRGQAQGLGRQVWIVQGKPGQLNIQSEGNLTLIPHLPSPELALALQTARGVISRSGYSSLMDYATLGLKQVALVPTPGQTEQEYLAGRMQISGKAMALTQTEFSLERVTQEIEACKGFAPAPFSDLLTAAVDGLTGLNS